MTFGARGPKVHELPLVVQMEYGIQWQRKPMDLTELAHKSRVLGWSNDQLATYFDRNPITIRIALAEILKKTVPSRSRSSANSLKYR